MISVLEKQTDEWNEEEDQELLGLNKGTNAVGNNKKPPFIPVKLKPSASRIALINPVNNGENELAGRSENESSEFTSQLMSKRMVGKLSQGRILSANRKTTALIDCTVSSKNEANGHLIIETLKSKQDMHNTPLEPSHAA